MPDTSDLLQQGIALAKAGQREEARNILMRVVELDEQNESAWLWLSGVVDSDDDKAVALENVLALNPNNDWAKRGLKLLGRPVPGK
jgi:Flp pilus assembly protein TadD